MNDADFISIVNKACEEFTGDSGELERAIGMLAFGRRVGWRVIYLTHSRATVRKYENILGVKLKDTIEDVGDLARKSYAWSLYQAAGQFWKRVKGKSPRCENT